MAETVTPKPMPLTSMPDRVYPPDQQDKNQELKAGIQGEQKNWNPGKGPSK